MTTATADIELSAEGVTVDYDGVRAVDAVELRLPQGRITGLIGPNGAGKSTFMGALSRFIDLSAGTIMLGDKDLTHIAAHRLPGLGVTRTFQDVAAFTSLSVRSNVELGALSAGLSRRQARRRADGVLGKLDLASVADITADALPTGYERRLGIARAIAGAPRFLLLDEPCAGLDDSESVALAGVIRELGEQQECGVLLVEHDMHVVFGICDYIHVLDFGRTIASGPPTAVQNDPKVVAAYLGQQGAKQAMEDTHAASR